MSGTSPGAQKWYVSYAWGGDGTPEGDARDKAVDELCEKARARGVEILRDKTALGVGDRISEFMRRLGQGDRVFVILSEKYLRSAFCMFELSEIWRNSRNEDADLLNRVRVYMLPGLAIRTAQDRLKWARYWRDEHDALETAINEAGLALAGERDLRDYRWMGRFYREVSDILATLTDIVKPRTIDELLAYGLADDPVRPRPPRADKPVWAADAGADRFGKFADFVLPNTSVRQRLRWIPPGRFWMGSPDSEEGRYPDEGPRHQVTIAEGFWLFDTPCTQELWQAVMGQNPSHFQHPRRPVERVSFEDVGKFLSVVNARVPGLNLVLPSEARWEYACRAGTETATYAGEMSVLGVNNAPVLDTIAWYGGNSGTDFDLPDGFDSSGWKEKQYPHTTAGTRIVAGKTPNPWGLYDMLGNVWEWCEDAWNENYRNGPTDGAAWLNADVRAGGAATRVLRGGSWGVGARRARAACRNHYLPDFRVVLIGFRCARVQSD